MMVRRLPGVPARAGPGAATPAFAPPRLLVLQPSNAWGVPEMHRGVATAVIVGKLYTNTAPAAAVDVPIPLLTRIECDCGPKLNGFVNVHVNVVADTTVATPHTGPTGVNDTTGTAPQVASNPVPVIVNKSPTAEGRHCINPGWHAGVEAPVTTGALKVAAVMTPEFGVATPPVVSVTTKSNRPRGVVVANAQVICVPPTETAGAAQVTVPVAPVRGVAVTVKVPAALKVPNMVTVGLQLHEVRIGVVPKQSGLLMPVATGCAKVTPA